MTVTFCGHREIHNQEEIKEKLLIILTQLINEGADCFLLGGYGAFDLIAANALHSLSADYPHIRSTLVIPYLNREPDLIELYDDTVYPPLEKVPPKLAIIKRNEWMVGKADVIVSCITHTWGGAAKTLEYARRKNKRVISLCEQTPS